MRAVSEEVPEITQRADADAHGGGPLLILQWQVCNTRFPLDQVVTSVLQNGTNVPIHDRPCVSVQTR